jgi:2-polyprenyl-3-methyl-5-hydroxy-6-metoxy-1,4-benzoquinol methylase
MAEWHEDGCFWDTFAGFMFNAQRIAAAAEEVECMAALLGIRRGQSILDLCCGVGRHALEFARRGFAVTGVDRTRSYLERARICAGHDGLQVEFVDSDMAELRAGRCVRRRDQPFHGIRLLLTQNPKNRPPLS